MMRKSTKRKLQKGSGHFGKKVIFKDKLVAITARSSLEIRA